MEDALELGRMLFEAIEEDVRAGKSDETLQALRAGKEELVEAGAGGGASGPA